MTGLRASIVIPSHNRVSSLERTLQALVHQTVPHEDFEVVVALDSCRDSSDTMLAARKWPYRLNSLGGDWGKPSAARNAGARAATGEILVFLDNDIEPDPGFLAGHLAAHAAAGGPAAVIGYSKPQLADEHLLFQQGLRQWWEDLFAEMARPGHRFAYTDVLSGNISLPRELFLAMDGFDEGFACREDYEFGWRLIERGIALGYAADALGWHHDARALRPGLARARAEGTADVAFIAKHPDALAEVGHSWPRRGQGQQWRLLRLAFTRPRLRDALLERGPGFLALLEARRQRKAWRAAHHALRRIAYFAGLADALTLAQYERLVARRPAEADQALFQARLEHGWEEIIAAVEREPVRGLALSGWGIPLPGLPHQRGAEPVRREHIEALRADPRVAVLERAGSAMRESPPAADYRPRFTSLAPDRLVTMGEIQLDPWSVWPRGEELRFPARFLVKRGREVLGWTRIDEPPAGVAAEDHLRTAVLAQVREPMARSATLGPLLPETNVEEPPISVVVCTRDRTENLRRCLAALDQLDYPDWELVIVDNAPASDAAERLVADHTKARYVREDRPGLDNARNRGIAESRHDIIAFTDDDTAADRDWLHAIARAFEEDEVAVVTGFVAPMALDTEAQLYFEDVYGGMGKGFQPRWFRRADIGIRGLLWSSMCGVGANMAYRRRTFDAVGLFDPQLDVGTPSRGAGDIDMFHRVLAAGLTLKYEPDALIWHEHRRTWEGLKTQLADNGCAFACHLMTIGRRGDVSRLATAKFAGVDWIGRWLAGRYVRPHKHRRDMIRAEFAGLLGAPRGWRRSRSK